MMKNYINPTLEILEVNSDDVLSTLGSQESGKESVYSFGNIFRSANQQTGGDVMQ